MRKKETPFELQFRENWSRKQFESKKIVLY